MREAPPWFEEYIDGNNRNVKLDIAIGAQMDMPAAADAALVDTNKMAHSVPSQIWDGNIAPNKYALFSRGGWETAAVTTLITPDAQTSPQAGVVSDVISDLNADIDWTAKIAFAREHQSGLTIYFTEEMVAEDFDIIVKDAVVQTTGGGEGGTPGDIGILWSISDGILSINPGITGSRAVIPNYAEGGAPWYEDRADITAIKISNLIFGIGANAFFGLSELVNVQSLGSSIYISAGAFKGCTSLQTITIPTLVGEIFGHAFSGCTALRSVTVQGSPQIYAGAFILGDRDTLVECAISGIAIDNSYGNRYTKLWQDSIGTTTGFDEYDSCVRYFGAGACTTNPSMSISNQKHYEEMLIFDRVTEIRAGSTTTYNTRTTYYSSYATIGSVYLGKSLDIFNISVGNSSIMTLKNGLSRPRHYNNFAFQNAENMVGGVNLASIQWSSTSTLNYVSNSFEKCKSLTEVIISFTAVEADGYRLGTAFTGADGLSSVTGAQCEDNVLYIGTYAYFYARILPLLKFKTGTIRIYSANDTTTSHKIAVDTLDIPSAIVYKVYMTGDADTFIVRCQRNYMPGDVSCRRLYCTYLGEDSSSSTNITKTGDMKLEILDLVGGSASTNRIRDTFIRNCPNVQEVRVRSAVSTTYCQMDYLNNAAPLKTFNCYTTSGTPQGWTYTAFVRVGTPPPREVT